jgi:hypothetical protein
LCGSKRACKPAAWKIYASYVTWPAGGLTYINDLIDVMLFSIQLIMQLHALPKT